MSTYVEVLWCWYLDLYKEGILSDDIVAITWYDDFVFESSMKLVSSYIWEMLIPKLSTS